MQENKPQCFYLVIDSTLFVFLIIETPPTKIQLFGFWNSFFPYHDKLI